VIFERTCFPSFQATGKENAKHFHHRDDSHGREDRFVVTWPTASQIKADIRLKKRGDEI
jgi:hypothetical protein